jgi:hypothetical protein
MRTLILTNNNYVSGNTFTYTFRNQLKAPEDIDAIALSSISFYNSTFNITSSYSNNTLTLNWLGTNYTITFPNGYYSATDMNAYLQFYFATNNLYMTNSAGNYIYFAEITTNSQRYAISLNLYAIPTSSQATTLGYSQPSGASWTLPSSTASTPQLTFNTAFGTLIGLSSGTYPTSAQSTTQQFVSTTTPIISPVNSYTLTCDLLNNPYSTPNNIFFTAPLTSSLGSLVQITPPQLQFNEIYGGTYYSLTIKLYDQFMNVLNFQDTEFVITLALRTKNDKYLLQGGEK